MKNVPFMEKKNLNGHLGIPNTLQLDTFNGVIPRFLIDIPSLAAQNICPELTL